MLVSQATLALTLCSDFGAVEDVQIEAVCNIKNVLCGPKGVARVYGPQKGATPKQVDLLAAALDQLARVAQATLGRDISQSPGSGASGGLGAGLMLLGARLRGRGEAINEYFELDRVFDQQWDFVITAEGSLDFQSPNGKVWWSLVVLL
jgi:glycerate kinase